MHIKMSHAKLWPYCRGRNVLNLGRKQAVGYKYGTTCKRQIVMKVFAVHLYMKNIKELSTEWGRYSKQKNFRRNMARMNAVGTFI